MRKTLIALAPVAAIAAAFTAAPAAARSERLTASAGRDLTSRRAEAACRDSLGAAFAPEVALAINNAGGENYAALEFSLKA